MITKVSGLAFWQVFIYWTGFEFVFKMVIGLVLTCLKSTGLTRMLLLTEQGKISSSFHSILSSALIVGFLLLMISLAVFIVTVVLVDVYRIYVDVATQI